MNGIQIEYVLERRAVLSRGGDIDELFSLSVRNVGSVPYSFPENNQRVSFWITDSAVEFVCAHDSATSSAWFREDKKREFVVGTLPLGELGIGDERIWGVHLLRRQRVGGSDQEVHFDDPLLLEPAGLSNARCASYRVVVVFPERHDGWEIIAPDASRATSRVATWEASHDGSPRRHVRATARAPARNAAVLLYDDIAADLDVLIGRDLCAEIIDLSDVLCKIKLIEHDFVREIIAPLESAGALTGVVRRSQLVRVLESMARMREVFLRSSSIERRRSIASEPMFANPAGEGPSRQPASTGLSTHMGLLEHQDIVELHRAITTARLADSRSPLLAGIEPGLVAGVPRVATPSGQIMQDLDALNSVGVLPDGSLPLAIWLANAIALAGQRKEVATFERMRGRVEQAGAQRAPGLSAEPGEAAPDRIQVRLFNLAASQEWTISAKPTMTLLQLIGELKRVLHATTWESLDVPKPTFGYQYRCYLSEHDEEPLSPHVELSDLLPRNEGRLLSLNVEWYTAFRGHPEKRVR